MKRYSYSVTLSYQGTFEMDDEEAEDYDYDALQDYALDQALSGTRYDVDEVVVDEVAASV